VYQYIFSGEGEYALDMHHIFSQHSPSIVVILTKSVPLEGMHPESKSTLVVVLGLGQCSTTYLLHN
jgi:hypothetical protein